MVQVDISIKEDIEQAKAIGRRLDDFRPVLRVIGEIGRTSIVRNFEVGGRPVKWKESRRARRTGGKTLVDRGNLRDSIAGAEPQITDDSVTIGTKDKRAAIHNFGGAIGTGKFLSRKLARRRKKGSIKVAFASIGGHEIMMPARPFMLLQDHDITAIKQAIADYIAGR